MPPVPVPGDQRASLPEPALRPEHTRCQPAPRPGPAQLRATAIRSPEPSLPRGVNTRSAPLADLSGAPAPHTDVTLATTSPSTPAHQEPPRVRTADNPSFLQSSPLQAPPRNAYDPRLGGGATVTDWPPHALLCSSNHQATLYLPTLSPGARLLAPGFSSPSILSQTPLPCLTLSPLDAPPSFPCLQSSPLSLISFLSSLIPSTSPPFCFSPLPDQRMLHIYSISKDPAGLL